MRFDLTEKQALVQQTARDFARREVEPGAAERDRAARWPAELVARLGERGYLGLTVPAALGGMGLDGVGYALVVEEISAACASAGAIASVHDALFCAPLLASGTEAQRREILAPAASGQVLGCAGLSGSATVAERQGDGSFLLNGSKRLVTLGPEADHALVLAVTDPERPQRTAFLLRRGSPGFTRSSPDEKMGLRAASSCTLFFENVRVPASHVLGEEGQGDAIAAAALDRGRVGVAAQALGIARAAFAKAADRVTMGAPERVPQPPPAHAGAPQSIQFMLSDMAVEIDAARLLTHRAARALDEGASSATAEIAMAKLFASEAATRVTHRALQIFGGEGYTAAGGVERCYRDARLTEIDEGTSETQRSIIASSVLGG
jgi:butyryl-CoA dehydrogenase